MLILILYFNFNFQNLKNTQNTLNTLKALLKQPVRKQFFDFFKIIFLTLMLYKNNYSLLK